MSLLSCLRGSKGYRTCRDAAMERECLFQAVEKLVFRQPEISSGSHTVMSNLFSVC